MCNKSFQVDVNYITIQNHGNSKNQIKLNEIKKLKKNKKFNKNH